MKGKKTLALFDFDGTITKKDSFIDFFEYYSGLFRFWMLTALLSPLLLLKVFDLYEAGRLKEKFFVRFLKGKRVEEVDKILLPYSTEKLPLILKRSALDEIKKHKRNGAEVALVSASSSLWLKHFAKEYEMELIATELEVKEGTFTGNIYGKNCVGPEKVKRIKEKYDLSEFGEIYAYGDSSGDKEMLEIASHKFYRHFK